MTEEPKRHPMVVFKSDLERMLIDELTVLDDQAKARMKNAAVVAVTKDPELLEADRQSFFMAIRMCANHGVIPDGNEAVLQVYNTNVARKDQPPKWVKKVTYLPMVRGIINRVQRSGKIRIFYAEIVCDGEEFRLDLSHGDRRPVHEFDPMRRSATIIGAYSVATYDDGTIDTEPMPRAEIDKVRNVAKTKNVWDNWFGEKAKVAVMKRHAKRLPLSAEDMDFIVNRDETDFEQARDVTPKTSFQRMADKARGKELPEPEHTDDAPVVEHETIDGEAESVDPVDKNHPSYVDGFEAGNDPESSRGEAIKIKDPLQLRLWMAGFDAARSITREVAT
jgi:recombination protein RecT